MASVQELKAVVKDSLESRGALNQIKARIRAEVFNALDDQTESRPPLSSENALINELIRDYLEFNNYKYTASVLQAESGQSKVPLDRDFLARELNIRDTKDSSSVPLLYGLVGHFLAAGGGPPVLSRAGRPSSPRRPPSPGRRPTSPRRSPSPRRAVSPSPCNSVKTHDVAVTTVTWLNTRNVGRAMSPVIYRGGQR